MPIVEIRVLSGARQGDRFEVDARELRVGAGPDCDFRFDPARDPGAEGRAVRLRLSDDGWTIRNAGEGEVLLNHEPVAGAVRVRSGDVVRLSERGPDFCFTILPKPSGLPSAPGTFAAPAPAAAPAQPAPAAAPAQPVPAGAGSSAAPLVAVAVVAFLVVAFVIGAGAVVLGWRLWASRAPAGPAVADQKPSSPADAVSVQPAEKTQKPSGRKPGEGTTQPAEGPSVEPARPDPAKPAAKDPWAGAISRLREAVWLLEVEEPKGRAAWPLATGTAVRGDTLLTSATAATELARFQKRGWKLFARCQVLGLRLPVKEARVHKGFDLLAGEPARRIYFDLGLATVEGKLAKTAAVAAADESAEVEPGMPVACVAIPHEGEAISRFQGLAPELSPGRVFIVTVLEQDPASPRLMHVKADVPQNVTGGAVVNAQGHVLGVYATPAVPPPGEQAEGLKLHYVVEARLVGAWLAGRDSDSWVAPALPEQPAKEPAKE